MMKALTAIKRGLFGTFDFFGRTTRFDFWVWVVTCFTAFFLLAAAIPSDLPEDQTQFLAAIIVGAVFTTTLSASVRRLHDIGKSGFWWLFGLSIVGLVPVLIWYCRPSALFEGRYVLSPQPTTSPSGGNVAIKAKSNLEALEKLGRLHQSGLLTSEEFAAEKARLLGASS